MIPRVVNISKSSSFFLFGARGTGKSTLLRKLFPKDECLWIDLLDPNLEGRLLRNPMELIQLWKSNRTEWIVIDEVQKLPKLLDVVHMMIEEEGVKFALTGSSSRKLKRGQANMLGGRSFSFSLFPFCVSEIDQLESEFDLEQALHFGTLPRAVQFETNADKIRFLNSYGNTYLKKKYKPSSLFETWSHLESFCLLLQ